MSKDNGCWCTFKFHLPGEKKIHLKAMDDARKMLQIVEDVKSRGRRSNR